MAQEHILRNEIISDHRERMLNLKKYYPFFKLTDLSFSQFKDGKYEILDMGYIVMAVLRFFIEENNFKEKDVTYPEYLGFMTECIRRDFALDIGEEEARDVADYIFDKIKNDGRPFSFDYYDPVERKKRTSRVRILESKIVNNVVWYSISADAIEFYLDTKEIKDESRISVQQLLLEKMIKAQNFTGGTEVIQRINEEVNRLQIRKNEVLAILSTDVFAGIEAYEDFVHNGMRWFDEEEKLFVKNKELIETALSRTEMAGIPAATPGYYRTIDEIFQLETQLKVAMNKHSELLRACTDMQKLTDDIVKKAKLSRLRTHFDFKSMQKMMIQKDDMNLLEALVAPLFLPSPAKRLDLIRLDDCLTYRPEHMEVVEHVIKEPPKEIKFMDEIEDDRIKYNYTFLMKNLLEYLEQREQFTLEELNTWLKDRYSDRIFHNGDYYSFFIHLCQKKEYHVGGQMQSESFLDEILQPVLEHVRPVTFTIQMQEDKMLKLCDLFEISDITFIRKSGTGNGTKES